MLSSCASTPKGLNREQQLYLSTSNAIVAVRELVPYAPPPLSGIAEGALALGGALMAVWASHLHRSLRDIQNGAKNGTASAPTGPPKA